MNNNFLSICDTCGQRTFYDKEQPCHCEYPKQKHCETCGHTEVIEPMQMEKCNGTLRLIDNSHLVERFTRYYENRQRVKVFYKDGTHESFYVGKSTGWKPIYLKIKTVNSAGGEAIGKYEDENITTIIPLNKYY